MIRTYVSPQTGRIICAKSDERCFISRERAEKYARVNLSDLASVYRCECGDWHAGVRVEETAQV